MMKGYEYQSDFAKKYVARSLALSIPLLLAACSGGPSTPGTGGATTTGSSTASGGTTTNSSTGGAGGATGMGGTATGGSGTTSTGGSAGSGGAAPAPPLWDMTMIRDVSTAACTYTNQHTALKNNVLLDVWEVSYISWESIAGQLQPI